MISGLLLLLGSSLAQETGLSASASLNLVRPCERDADCSLTKVIISSVRSSNSHPDLLVITTTTTTPLFQITPVLNTGLSLSEPLQLYKGYDAI